jgi:hypothetical protein
MVINVIGVIDVANSFSIPEHMAELFWDIDLKSLDPVENSDFIIERVLNMGDEDGLSWLWNGYSSDKILEVVKTSRRISRKTARCWQNYFDLREDEMRCFSTYSMSPDKFY